MLKEIDETPIGETLQLAAWLGVSPLGTDVGDLATWVVEHGVSWVTSDVSSDPRTRGIDCAMIPYAYVGVPMRSRGREVGVFSVVGRVGQQFSAEEVALLSSIADHVAGAVESARLRREAERTAVMEERERLARELHDSVTQLLYSLSLFAETGRRLAGAGELQDTEGY
ncbi:MAG: GAF domain-containing protein, partial [bacterium]|nr:GAF domain-containing protein [bacterium]